MSRSSNKGALASIAASVTGMEVSWLGGRLERVMRIRKRGEGIRRRKREIVRMSSWM